MSRDGIGEAFFLGRRKCAVDRAGTCGDATQLDDGGRAWLLEKALDALCRQP